MFMVLQSNIISSLKTKQMRCETLNNQQIYQAFHHITIVNVHELFELLQFKFKEKCHFLCCQNPNFQKR